jgi:predicted nucleic acid-binding protein
MSLRVPKRALVDTGFWYALLDERDSYHSVAKAKTEGLFRLTYLVPWPVMYETLCTRFVRRPHVVRTFETLLKRPNAIQVDDCKYRDEALSLTLNDNRARGISLVDNVLRMLLEDRSIVIGALYTFNQRDFADICRHRGVVLV